MTDPRWVPAGRLVEVSGCLMWLAPDRVLRCLLAPGRDDLLAARRFLRAVVELGGGPGTPIGFQLSGAPLVSQAERLVYLASTEAAAIGLVVADPAQVPLARRLARLVGAQCPSRVFTATDDADRWLCAVEGGARDRPRID